MAIPPALLDYSSGRPTIILQNQNRFEYGSCEFGNPLFLQSIVNVSKVQLDHQMLDWKYEQRRTAQPVLPYLYLGPSTTARSQEFVRGHGITLLLAVRSGATARARSSILDPTKFASSCGIQSLTLDLDEPYDLMTRLPQTVKAINDHVEQSCNGVTLSSLDQIPGKVLVFCESGNERSATVVAAYLMVLYGFSVVQAVQMIQSQRFCIAIDDGMKHMLQGFNDILQAKRDVAGTNLAEYSNGQLQAAQADGMSTVARPGKRDLDSAYESGDEMGPRGWDNGTAVGRSDWAPFHDVAE